MDDQNKSVRDDDRSVREIRSEIEDTRADMAETIDAIQDKLRPGNIAAQATESVKNATVGKVKQMANSARERMSGSDDRYGTRSSGGGVVDRIRENPVPAAIAAASIAYIAFAGGNRNRTSPAIYGSTREGEGYLRETVISENTDDVAEYGEYSDYSTRSQGLTDRAQSAMRGASSRARQVSSSTRNGMQRMMDQNPLAAGAIAAAVGVTIGLALPETERENEIMGEARDTVVTKAQDAARGAAEKVQDAASRVGDLAGEAAKTVSPGSESSGGFGRNSTDVTGRTNG